MAAKKKAIRRTAKKAAKKVTRKGCMTNAQAQKVLAQVMPPITRASFILHNAKDTTKEERGKIALWLVRVASELADLPPHLLADTYQCRYILRAETRL